MLLSRQERRGKMKLTELAPDHGASCFARAQMQKRGSWKPLHSHTDARRGRGECVERSTEQACAPKTPVHNPHCKQLPGIFRVTACSLSATQSDPLVFHTMLLHPCLAASSPYHHTSLFVFYCTEHLPNSSAIRQNVSASNSSIQRFCYPAEMLVEMQHRQHFSPTCCYILTLSFFDRLKTQAGTV